MIVHYFTIAVRNLVRNIGTTAVNIFGLALGMACCILLSLTVHQEMSFDTFYAKKDRLFRVYQQLQTINGEELMTSQPIPLAPTLKAEIPEIEYSSSVSSSDPVTLKYNGSVFRESPIYVGEDFFRMFSFPFLQGSADAALNDLRSIVLTKSVADKMFGIDANALGKQVQLQLEGEYKSFFVSGVITDLPQTSSLEISTVIRTEHLPEYQNNVNRWDNISTDTYICLKQGTSAQAVEESLVKFVNTHFLEFIRTGKETGVRPSPRGTYIEEHLQPISDLHFGTVLDKTGRAKLSVYTLMAVAGFIFLIASINFINLLIARSFTRSREVGIRKTVGARRSQIVMQFLGESMLVVLFAMLMSVVLAEALIPAYNGVMNIKLSLILDGGIGINILWWGSLTLVFASIGLASAVYPAFYVSRLTTVSTIKSGLQRISPSRLRNALVVLQFTISIMLIISTLVLREQVLFLQHKPLGFSRDYVVMIPTGDGANGKTTMEKLRSLLVGNPHILSMSNATKPIGRGLDNSNTRSHINRSFNGGQVSVDVLSIDFNYIETMQIPMLAGRTFSKDHITTDTLESVIVNELAARQIWSLLPMAQREKLSNNGVFTPQAIVGVSVPSDEKNVPPMNIIGVSSDYHIESLKRKMEPAIHVMWSGYPASYIFVKIRPDNMVSTIEVIKSAWQKVSPDVPYQGSFLDENIERLYRRESRQTILTLTAAGIAIALSCMGLFALAAIIIGQRTKEIGIRKVLGASVVSIVGLLSKDFLRLVLVAIIVASPLAWWAMNSWLQDFAYRIDLRSLSGVWIFAASGLTAVVIAFATIAGQAWRAARSNPVHSLRSE